MAGIPFRAGAELTPLHDDHVKVLRIRAALVALPLLAGAIVGEVAVPGLTGLFLIPWAIFAAIAIWRLPLRRWSYKGYDIGGDRLRTVRGFLWRSDTVVPFTRVQHIDVEQSPLERLYDLATLTVHTAGTHNASVKLEGVKRDTAEAMRDAIRARIRNEAT